MNSSKDKNSELDELDLFSNADPLAQDDSLNLQLTALSSRMQKRFEEHREAESQAEKDARSRHLILMTGLMRARKILRGVANLQIGGGVELKLVCDDLQGWPRIAILPRKIDDPDIQLSGFEVSGTDRSGISQIEVLGGKIREQLLLPRPEDLDRIPRLMKRVVRFYLDTLAEEILSAKRKPAEEKLPEKIIEEAPSPGPALHGADLFEEALGEDILETLPELGALEKL